MTAFGDGRRFGSMARPPLARDSMPASQPSPAQPFPARSVAGGLVDPLSDGDY